MAELWQAYGNWILYGLLFLAFLWLHARMHGHGAGHRGHGAPKGHSEFEAQQRVALNRQEPGENPHGQSGASEPSQSRRGCC